MIDDDAGRRRHRNERIAAALLVVVLGAALAAFMAWNRRADEEFRRERTYVPNEQPITRDVRMLQEYVRIDTTPGRERAGAQWLAAQLASGGVRAELIEPAPGRTSVYARIRGKRRGEGLMLLNHIDVVAANPAEWKKPPFSGEIELGSMYGRGVLDMKGIALCQLLAFLDVARSGRTPERDLVFLAVADEENGGALGTQWLLEHRRDVFDGVAYVLNEGGATEMVAERVTYYGIEIGSTQYVQLTLAAPSLEAYRQARFALAPYFVPMEPERILPEVRRHFRDLAPARHTFREILGDIDAAVARGDFWRLPPPYRALTQNTLRLDWPRREGSEYHATLRLSNLPDEDPDARIQWVRERVAPFKMRVAKVDHKDAPTPFSPVDTPLYRLIAAEAERTWGARAGSLVLHRSLNDSRFLRRRGIACYGVLPHRVDAFQSRSIHGANEVVRLEWFVEGIGFLQRIVRGWVFTGQ